MRGQLDCTGLAQGSFLCDDAIVCPAFGGGHKSLPICENLWNFIPKKVSFTV